MNVELLGETGVSVGDFAIDFVTGEVRPLVDPSPAKSPYHLIVVATDGAGNEIGKASRHRDGLAHLGLGQGVGGIGRPRNGHSTGIPLVTDRYSACASAHAVGVQQRIGSGEDLAGIYDGLTGPHANRGMSDAQSVALQVL